VVDLNHVDTDDWERDKLKMSVKPQPALVDPQSMSRDIVRASCILGVSPPQNLTHSSQSHVELIIIIIIHFIYKRLSCHPRPLCNGGMEGQACEWP